jgi:hypothetical protein
MSDTVSPGYYSAVAVPLVTENGQVWAQFGRAKNGTEQVLVTYEILSGEFAGQRLPWFGYFTKNTYERTIESLRYSGLRGDDISKAVDGPMEQEVTIQVEHNEWEGKVHSRVAFVNKAGGGGVKLADPMKSDELRKFAAKMKTSLHGKPEVEGKKAERASGSNGAAAESDDYVPPSAGGAKQKGDIPF